MNETIEDRAATFKMPRVTIGTQVLWYENGLSNANPSVLMVSRVFDRRIEGRFLSGHRMVVCPHLSDPTLEINEHHREEGAWDWTDHYKLELSERAALKQQIHTLTLAVADLRTRIDNRSANKERMAKVRAARGKKTPVPQEAL